jgi:hypothetical protein
MNKARFAGLLILIIALTVAGYFTLRSFGLLGTTGLAEVKDVPPGHQEVAFLAAATSGDGWERLVAAVRQIEKDWASLEPDQPPLRVSYKRAFLELTADVPELALWLEGAKGAKLWIRWYKLSSEIDTRTWIQKLTRRATPPLAVLGGDSSDRALTLAQALEEARQQWNGAAPVLLITTATADRYHLGENQSTPLTGEYHPRLIEVYKGRSFRFAFTNSCMAQEVMYFVGRHPELWSHIRTDPSVLAGSVAAAAPGAGGLPGPWGTLGVLAAAGHLQPHAMYTLAWSDDRYSIDLADRFGKVFQEKFCETEVNGWVWYGVGDFDNPNPKEALAAGLFLGQFLQQDEGNGAAAPAAGSLLPPARRQMLVLPTAAQRARRFLRTVARRAPIDVRNLVVLCGDSITFNNVYRDRDVAWNIQDVPVSLVFFSHRNPVNAAAGFRLVPTAQDPSATTGTQDLLLYRDIGEALVQTAYRADAFVTDGDDLLRRMGRLQWRKGHVFLAQPPSGPLPRERLLFDKRGDRHQRTGEHIIWLKPHFAGTQVLPEATITVWSLPSDTHLSKSWRLQGEPLTVRYDQVTGGD